MNVLITGGAGFLGRRLADALLRRGSLRTVDGSAHPIEELTLLDVVGPAPADDSRVRIAVGDISDPAVVERFLSPRTTSVFHLAAVVSAMAEADFELGLRINVDATRRLLDVCRLAGHRPRVVFASSVAVFGGPMAPVVNDSTRVNPQSSYGTQKAIGELLIGDYTRKGFIDGRVLRLPTISVRPGKPNAAASSFVSGIVREPLNGEEAACPVDPDTPLLIMSPATVIDCLIRGHEIASRSLGADRVINLPGISVTPRAMVSSLERVAGGEVARRVRWQRDESIERIVASWPGAWDTSRARALGFPADASVDDLIRAYMTECGSTA